LLNLGRLFAADKFKCLFKSHKVRADVIAHGASPNNG
jgi:hypothetical protein